MKTSLCIEEIEEESVGGYIDAVTMFRASDVQSERLGLPDNWRLRQRA